MNFRKTDFRKYSGKYIKIKNAIVEFDFNLHYKSEIYLVIDSVGMLRIVNCIDFDQAEINQTIVSQLIFFNCNDEECFNTTKNIKAKIVEAPNPYFKKYELEKIDLY